MTIFGKRNFVDTVKGVGTIFLIRFNNNSMTLSAQERNDRYKGIAM